MNKMTRKIVNINFKKAEDADKIGDALMVKYHMDMALKAETQLYEICKKCDEKDCSGTNCEKLAVSVCDATCAV